MSKQKTREINVGEQAVPVDVLPKEIRDSIDFFDRMAGDIDKVRYELNVLIVASTGMKNKIMEDTVQWIKSQQPEETQDPAEVDDAPTPVPEVLGGPE